MHTCTSTCWGGTRAYVHTPPTNKQTHKTHNPTAAPGAFACVAPHPACGCPWSSHRGVAVGELNSRTQGMGPRPMCGVDKHRRSHRSPNHSAYVSTPARTPLPWENRTPNPCLPTRGKGSRPRVGVRAVLTNTAVIPSTRRIIATRFPPASVRTSGGLRPPPQNTKCDSWNGEAAGGAAPRPPRLRRACRRLRPRTTMHAAGLSAPPRTFDSGPGPSAAPEGCKSGA